MNCSSSEEQSNQPKGGYKNLIASFRDSHAALRNNS